MQKKLFIAFLYVFLLFGCASNAGFDKDIYIDNPKQTLAWQGTYQGITPCAGCEGVATMLILQPSNEYQLRTRLLGKEDKDHKYDGRFAWLPNNTHIKVMPENGVPKIYRVTADFLELTLPDGERIPTDDPDQYRLYKTN